MKIRTTLSIVFALFATAVSGQDAIDILFAQIKLRSLGFEEVSPDGRMGPITRAALAETAVEHGFEPTVGALLVHFARSTVEGRVAIEDEALIAAIEESVKRDLIDPFSAHIRDVYRLPSGNICGEVNAKNRMGAYVGWEPFFILSPMQFGADSWYVGPAFMDQGENDLYAMTCLLDM